MTKFIVPLRNFSEDEAKCKCGCNKNTSPSLMLKVQALIYRLEQKTGRTVRCLLTSGARCSPHNTRVYNGTPTPSYHMGPKKRDDGIGMPGSAVDAIMQFARGDEWETFDKDFVAKEAIAMGIFGGVGWEIYGPTEEFVHLDEGPVRTF